MNHNRSPNVISSPLWINVQKISRIEFLYENEKTLYFNVTQSRFIGCDDTKNGSKSKLFFMSLYVIIFGLWHFVTLILSIQ